MAETDAERNQSVAKARAHAEWEALEHDGDLLNCYGPTKMF